MVTSTFTMTITITITIAVIITITTTITITTSPPSQAASATRYSVIAAALGQIFSGMETVTYTAAVQLLEDAMAEWHEELRRQGMVRRKVEGEGERGEGWGGGGGEVGGEGCIKGSMCTSATLHICYPPPP